MSGRRFFVLLLTIAVVLALGDRLLGLFLYVVLVPAAASIAVAARGRKGPIPVCFRVLAFGALAVSAGGVVLLTIANEVAAPRWVLLNRSLPQNLAGVGLCLCVLALAARHAYAPEARVPVSA